MSWRTVVHNVALVRWLGAAAIVTVVAVLLNLSTLTELSLFNFSRSKDAPPVVSAYVTTADGSSLFARDPAALQFAHYSSQSLPAIMLNEHERFQAIDGFGGVLTGSSAYLLANRPDHGEAVLADLFRSDTGIGLSYIRVTIGASDFSLGSYTYDDMAPGSTDPPLAAFSVARDAQVISVLQAIHATSSDVKFMASPWTAPAWMKSSQKLFGGGLRPESYSVYARYITDYVRELKSRGIALDAITPQNEPLLSASTYPSMSLSPQEETAFVKTALGPALAAAAPATKLVINDHNWEGESYPLTILHDPDASRYVAGTAFHCYAGQVKQMSRVRDAYPGKGIYIDECSGGAWAPDFRDNLRWDVRNLIIGGTVNWARTVLFGNLALDDAAGPTNGGCATCRGILTLHADGSITRNVEYYVLEHAARFVRPGAVRIASSTQDPALPNVAYLNTDGSEVLIVLNDSIGTASFVVRSGSNAFRYSLRGGSVATFRWL